VTAAAISASFPILPGGVSGEEVNMTDLDKIIELFSQFTRLRQTGRSRDQAWQDLKPEIDSLSKAHRDRLIDLCRTWEVKEGRNYPSHEDPADTRFKPPLGIESVRQAPNGSKSPKDNRIRRIQSVDSDQSALPHTLECPVCHAANPEGELYCHQCGALLAQVGDVPDEGDTRPLEANGGMHDTSYFGADTVLYLRVLGDERLIRLRIGTNEVMIGRTAPDSVMIPDVDLSPYQADSKGISRLHAALRRHDETLVLTDMGSLNYTYINGQRLHAHEVRVLHDGDEVRLGQLPLQVFFRRE
jgi:hypothetical protein